MRLLMMMLMGAFLCTGNLSAELGDGALWESWNDYSGPAESIQEADDSNE